VVCGLGLCGEACPPAVAASLGAPALTSQAERFPTEPISTGAAALGLVSPLSCPPPLPDGCSESQKHRSSFPVPLVRRGGLSRAGRKHSPVRPQRRWQPRQGGTHRAGRAPPQRRSREQGLGFPVSRPSSRGSRSVSISWLGGSTQERDAGALLPEGCLATPWSRLLSRDLLGPCGWSLGSPCSPWAGSGGTDPLLSLGRGVLPLRAEGRGFSALALELKEPNCFLRRPRIPVTLNMKMVMPSWSVLWATGVGGRLCFGE